MDITPTPKIKIALGRYGIPRESPARRQNPNSIDPIVKAVTLWKGGCVKVTPMGTPDSIEMPTSKAVTQTPLAEASGGATDGASPAIPATTAEMVIPVWLEDCKTCKVTAHAQKKARPPRIKESRLT